MRKHYIFLLIFFLRQIACGQNPTNAIQSREEALSKTAVDTQRVNILNKLAVELFSSHPEKTKIYGSRAQVLADSLHYQKGIADACYSLSLIAKLKGDYTRELDYHGRSLKIYQNLNDSASVARTFNAIGLTHHQLQNNELAQEFFTKAVNIYRTTGDREGIAAVLRRIRNIELNNKKYDKALRAYFASLETERKIEHEEGIANCMNNIGFAYYEQNMFDSALHYLHQSLEIMQKLNNLIRLPAAYRNLGQVYLAMGKTDEALGLAKKGLPLAEKLGLRPAVLEATKLLADIYLKKKDYVTSLKKIM